MADPTEEQLKAAARKALAAGDIAAAKRLTDAARKVGAAPLQAGPFNLGSGPQTGAGPFSVQSEIPKWQQAPEVPKWQQAPEVAPKPWERYAAKTPSGNGPAEVEMPDGTILEFPGGTDPATMKAATAKYWAEAQGKFSPEQQAAIEAARGRLAAANGKGQFTPEQQAALDAARARMAGGNQQSPATAEAPIYAAPRALPGASARLQKPGSMTLDDALSSLSETWKNPPAPISQGRAAVVSGAHGATFGFADEIVGGLLALHPRIDYDNAVNYLRQEVDDAREFYPKTALAGEVGGSIAMPGKAAASFINKGATTGARMARGAIAGGTSGAVYGFGSGEGGAGERAVNALGMGAAGALGGGALVGLGQGFNKLLGMVSQRPELKEVAPTLAGLRVEATKLYEAARESGAVLPSADVQKMVTGIQATLREVGFDTDLHPRVSAVLKRLTGEAGDKSLADVEILRRVAGNAAESISPDERRLAGIVMDKIDDAIDGMGEGGAAMKTARETWGRLRRMETIEAAIERAGNAKASFASALQSEFRSILRSPRKLRGFSATERAEIAKIARGGPVTLSLQALGAALSPSRPLGAVLAGGTAYGFGPSALALPASGLVANKIAEALAKRGGRKLAESVGSSDARRAIVEALSQRPNALAGAAPSAPPMLNALASYLGGH